MWSAEDAVLCPGVQGRVAPPALYQAHDFVVEGMLGMDAIDFGVYYSVVGADKNIGDDGNGIDGIDDKEAA